MPDPLLIMVSVPSFLLAGALCYFWFVARPGWSQRQPLPPVTGTDVSFDAREFWVRWFLASLAGSLAGGTLGGIIGYLGQLIILSRAGPDPNPYISYGSLRELAPLYFSNAISSTLAGLGVGLGQWLVLRRNLRRPDGWVIATSVGYAVAAALFTLTYYRSSLTPAHAATGAASALVFGSAIGAAQWWVLRSQFRDVGFWVLATVGSWLALPGLLWLVSLAADDRIGQMVLFLAGFLSVPVAHGVTGFVMMRLLEHRLFRGQRRER